MDPDDAILGVVEGGTSILLGATPVLDMPGYPIVKDCRIKGLAEAVRDMRECFRL
jgi:hypothetical protein